MASPGPVPDGDDGDHPVELVLVRNDDSRSRQIRVVRRRNGSAREDHVELAPGEDRTLPLPEGDGTVSVVIGGEDAAAAATYDPDRQPALFTIRRDSVLVAHA